MNTFRISIFCILLVMVAGCTHPLSRQEKKGLAKTVRVAMMMSMVGAGAGGSTAGMDDSAAGIAGMAAFGVGASVAVRQSIVLNLDKREDELRQSESAKRGYLIVERPTPYQLRMLTDHQASFDTASPRLTPQSHIVLNDIAETMQRHKDAKLIITGYADDGGTEVGKTRLAERRARAAIRYLEQRGVKTWRIERNGKTRPEYAAGGKKGISIYRRLEMTLASRLLGLKADLKMLERNIRQLQSAKDNDLMVKKAGPDTLKLTMAHRAAFTSGSALLTDRGRVALGNLAALLERHPYATVEVIGHANDGGSVEKNRSLFVAVSKP